MRLRYAFASFDENAVHKLCGRLRSTLLYVEACVLGHAFFMFFVGPISFALPRLVLF